MNRTELKPIIDHADYFFALLSFKHTFRLIIRAKNFHSLQSYV